jgi:hypothetical protein
MFPTFAHDSLHLRSNLSFSLLHRSRFFHLCSPGRSRQIHADAADMNEIELPEDLIPPCLRRTTKSRRSRDIGNSAVASDRSGEDSDESSCDDPGGREELVVRVSVAAPCRDAVQVRVRAATRDDYALLCHSASYLESGGWLRMVSVAYPDQILYVPTEVGNDFARCQVLWHDDDISSIGGCCRLVAATQVIVLPPTRSRDDLDDENNAADDDGEDDVALSVIPGALDYNLSMHELASHLGVSLLSVGQGRAVVHPNVAPWIARRFSLDADAGLDPSASHPAGFLALLESAEVPDHSASPDEHSESFAAKLRTKRVIVRLEASLLVPTTGIGECNARFTSLLCVRGRSGCRQ